MVIALRPIRAARPANAAEGLGPSRGAGTSPLAQIDSMVSGTCARVAVATGGYTGFRELNAATALALPINPDARTYDAESLDWWGKLSRGSPRARLAIKRGDPRFLAHIAALGPVGERHVRDVIGWRLWRLMDPRPLGLWEISEWKCDHPFPWWLSDGRTPDRSELPRCWPGRNETAREAAWTLARWTDLLHRVWLGLRTAEAKGDFRHYAAMYRLWLECRQPLEHSYVFRRVVERMYALSHECFATVLLRCEETEVVGLIDVFDDFQFKVPLGTLAHKPVGTPANCAEFRLSLVCASRAKSAGNDPWLRSGQPDITLDAIGPSLLPLDAAGLRIPPAVASGPT